MSFSALYNLNFFSINKNHLKSFALKMCEQKIKNYIYSVSYICDYNRNLPEAN